MVEVFSILILIPKGSSSKGNGREGYSAADGSAVVAAGYNYVVAAIITIKVSVLVGMLADYCSATITGAVVVLILVI